MTPNAQTAVSETKPNFEETLRTLTRSRHPVIWVVTHEEERALRYVEAVAKLPKTDGSLAAKPVYEWSQSRALGTVVDGKFTVTEEEMVNPVAVLQHIVFHAHDDDVGALYVLRDLHKFLGDGNSTYRFLRDAVNELHRSKVTIVITSPVATIPNELSKDIVVVDMPLPTETELGVRLDATMASFTLEIPALVNGERERVLRAGAGLTEDEFQSAVIESAIRSRTVDPKLVVKAKEQIVRKSGVIELYQSVESLSSVGGLDNLKDWISYLPAAFSSKGRAFGLRAAKGALFVGPPGTGKSLMAKAAASTLGVPLLWVKPDAIFSKYVGESEQNLRKIFAIADAVAPAILFIDEVEKLLAGSQGGEGDSGVARRCLGSILTWLQEHTSPVLVLATANDSLALPPELVGRFDQTFFIDLPSTTERADIFGIHLNRLGRNTSHFDLARLAKQTQGYSGREIERVINDALNLAFREGTELGTEHLVVAAKGVRTLSQTRKEDIERMRSWAKNNATPASSKPAETDKLVVSHVEL